MVMVVAVLAVSALAMAKDAQEVGPLTIHGVLSATEARALGETVQVNIRNYMYTDEEIVVPVGTTVVWLQQDSDQHNVRFFAGSDNGLEEDHSGPMLRVNQRWAVTFNEVGTYDYMCDPHPFMVGTVRVVAAD